MCSKPPERRRRARRGGSITRRFALLYVGSLALLLLLTGGFLSWTLQRMLDARDHALVVSKARVLRRLLREAPDSSSTALISEIQHEAGAGALRYYLRVLDAAGRTLLETPGMSVLLPPVRFPPAQDTLPEPARRETANVRHAGSFLLLAVRAETSGPDPAPRLLHVALDVSEERALLAEYRRQLLVGLLGALAAAALASVWLARKGLQPVAEMTRRVRHVSASHLNERIQISQWPVELAELAAAFNAMLDRLEDSFTRLNRFAADLAHELRTPINNLCGEAEVALARRRSSAEYQETLGSALEEYERLARMIDNLLFIARADNPRAEIERVRFDARTEIEAVRDYQEAFAEEQGVTVACEGEADLTGDPALFRRAVSNLLANAIRHTPPGGRVVITVRPLPDGGMELRVRDTGRGIAPEDLPHIFDRFYRAGGTGDRASGGTGLGLAIVRSIVRLHGGQVSARSEPGQGATFTLRFPPAA